MCTTLPEKDLEWPLSVAPDFDVWSVWIDRLRRKSEVLVFPHFVFCPTTYTHVEIRQGLRLGYGDPSPLPHN